MQPHRKGREKSPGKPKPGKDTSTFLGSGAPDAAPCDSMSLWERLHDSGTGAPVLSRLLGAPEPRLHAGGASQPTRPPSCTW